MLRQTSDITFLNYSLTNGKKIQNTDFPYVTQNPFIIFKTCFLKDKMNKNICLTVCFILNCVRKCSFSKNITNKIFRAFEDTVQKIFNF